MNDQERSPGLLPWSGERYVPQVSGNIRLEHLHRYAMARGFCDGLRVLDIACGEGYGSQLLAEVAGRVYGVDISEEAVAHARATYARSNLEFLVGSCTAIPLADASVDVVVSFETLEHLAAHDEMMREVRRVLAPGGSLILSSPDRHEYSEVPGYANPFHVRELDRGELERLLHAHFAHVTLAGQRMKAGSLIWPLSGDASGFVGAAAEEGVSRIDPLGPPLYFLAIASDRPVPPIPAGLLDGGGFVWFKEHVAAYEEAEKLFHAHFAQLEAGRETARHEADRQRERADAAEGELQRRQQEDADRDSLAARHRAEVTAANDDRARLDAAVRSLQEALAREEAARQRIEREHHLLVTSQSWRLTAPLRAMRRALAAGQPLGRTLVTALLGIYHGLPISIETRLRIRSLLFRTFPLVFRRTAAYKAWDALRRTQYRPPEASAVHATAAAAAGTAPGQLPAWFYAEGADEYLPLTRTSPVDTRIRAIAFYLPQFHPIPENDRWWGKGFTEWTNVSRGKPQFVGHYQPHLPDELGFYDLRLPSVQRRQIELAKQFGLHGFCYHHYWFGGKRLLRQPLDQLLANPDMDFPFCLCWANENWTRRWDGYDAEVLIAQQHSPEDDLAFIRDIEPALRDPRYIRVDGKLLLVVYRPALLPDARATAERWRRYCRDAGIGELYLVSTHSFDRINPADFGFDAALEFAPNNLGVAPITHEMPLVNPEFRGVVYDYRQLVEHSRTCTPPADYTLFRSVTPMWDNEARRPGRGAVFAHSSPALYREALEHTCRYTDTHLTTTPFVFINAWNEWAEGAHLEPDRRYGYAYLQATADALRRFPTARRAPVVCVTHDAHYHGAQLLTLNLARTIGSTLGRSVDVLLCGDGPLVPDFEQAARVHDFRPGTTTADARAAIARELYAEGARVALCNTCATGDAVAHLKAAGFTVVSMVHELPELIRRHQLEASAGQVATHADRVVFAAERVRDEFIGLTGLPRERAVVHAQGLYLVNRYRTRKSEARKQLRTRLELGPDTAVVLGAGFADHRKGIDLFVEVGLLLAERLPDLRMVWIGHHDVTIFGQAIERIEAAGRTATFIFPGIIQEPDFFFAGADLYLLTSREDPFPAVVLEALDVEVPAIAFEDSGGIPELFRRGCGVLVPFADVNAMAEAAIRVLGDAGEREQLAAAGRRIIDEEFDFPSYARFLIDLATPPHPSVSVVVPNYNYARYLPQRLRSIIAQTLRPDEIIVLDDASSDDSAAIAERLLAGSGIPYRVIRNETNAGCYPQWLRGIGEARGELLWIAEADDDCEPTLLETLVPAFRDPDVVLAYCQSRQIDGDGRELAPDYLAWTADIDPDKWRRPYVRRGLDEIRDSLIIKNTIPNVSAVVLRRPDLSAIADRLVRLRNAGDWLVYMHVLERGALAFVPEALNRHRRHGGSVTLGKGGLNLMREILTVQAMMLDHHPITAATEARREATLQQTYEYLGLNAGGPPSYKDHEALKEVLPVTAR